MALALKSCHQTGDGRIDFHVKRASELTVGVSFMQAIGEVRMVFVHGERDFGFDDQGSGYAKRARKVGKPWAVNQSGKPGGGYRRTVGSSVLTVGVGSTLRLQRWPARVKAAEECNSSIRGS